jgi:predicted Fe-Mo cluster-binding NifX family protein
MNENSRQLRASRPFSQSGYGPGYGRRRGRGMGSFGPLPYQPSQQPFQMPAGTFKVAVATEGLDGLDDIVSSRFGRCPTFTIVTIEGSNIKDVKTIENQAALVPHGAGVAAVQALTNEEVKVIVAGRFGPWASQASIQFGIQMVIVPPGTRVKDAITGYILRRR